MRLFKITGLTEHSTPATVEDAGVNLRDAPAGLYVLQHDDGSGVRLFEKIIQEDKWFVFLHALPAKPLPIPAASGLTASFEIWCEGWAATGGCSQAHLFGTSEGTDFRDACERYFANKASDEDKKHFSAKGLTYWGCRLFPTGEEARRHFG